MANSVLRGACLPEADISGARLDGAVFTQANLRKSELAWR
ncbi:MAG: pentapeptide repeat-containing protein, partial [Alphaproteobacteria bacterium]|nr:pentapeptide repeat-containing protein [Alphaproteobacteria bacterium]